MKNLKYVIIGAAVFAAILLCCWYGGLDLTAMVDDHRVLVRDSEHGAALCAAFVAGGMVAAFIKSFEDL